MTVLLPLKKCWIEELNELPQRGSNSQFANDDEIVGLQTLMLVGIASKRWK